MALLKYILAIIILFSFLWAISRLFKTKNVAQFFRFSTILILSFLLLELSLNVIFRVENGQWFFLLKEHPNAILFEKHPYLSVVNKPLIDTEFQGYHVKHDKYGNRNEDFTEEDLKTKTIVAAIGGSTTYGVGVSNNETWPAILDSLFGPDTIVINLGVPGYTSVEHLITASLYLEKYKADVILLHTGLNDLRMSHVNDLKDDYLDFQEAHLVGSMGLCYLEKVPKIATLYYGIRFMQSMDIYPVCDFHKAEISGSPKKGVDAKAVEFYRNHLKRLIYISRYYTNNIMFIPQASNEERLNSGKLQWWIPFVPPNELYNILKEYNSISVKEAKENQIDVLEEVVSFSWTSDQFSDPSHLNAKGNQRLAEMIYSKFKDATNINAEHKIESN